jgi:hypothetical protein
MPRGGGNFAEAQMNFALESTKSLRFSPLVAANWSDLEELFGARGACGGCWCMTWRLRHAEFQKNKERRTGVPFRPSFRPENRQACLRIPPVKRSAGVPSLPATFTFGWRAPAF